MDDIELRLIRKKEKVGLNCIEVMVTLLAKDEHLTDPVTAHENDISEAIKKVYKSDRFINVREEFPLELQVEGYGITVKIEVIKMEPLDPATSEKVIKQTTHGILEEESEIICKSS